ncbi:MAG: hypothetical protein H7296_12175, partial [Bacteroidia bacterium]|nr:hypothetical protein [Bacteroidia bacterium]
MKKKLLNLKAMIKINFKRIRIKRLALICFLFLSFLSYRVEATHVVGSDVTYTCTGTPGVYQVTFKIYRDCSDPYPLCSGCPTPGPLSSGCNLSISIVGAAGSCTGTSFGSQSISVVTAVSALDVIQLCASSLTVCTNCASRTPGSFTPGIEVYTFVGQINLSGLPASCCMVYLGYQTCCRNGAITTLSNPLSLSFFTQATINRCASPCNSAPAFTNDPVAVTCAGQDFTYNLGAIDPDGDSLSYAFGQSLVG